jgi:hypothetical protein
MTRPPSEAVDLTRLIPHLQEHLLHVGQPKFAGIVLLECVELTDPFWGGFLTKSALGFRLQPLFNQSADGFGALSERPNVDAAAQSYQDGDCPFPWWRRMHLVS